MIGIAGYRSHRAVEVVIGVDTLINAAPNPRARLLFLVEWRAGLRISEALAVEVRDLSLDTDRPTIRVRQGKARTTDSSGHRGRRLTGG